MRQRFAVLVVIFLATPVLLAAQEADSSIPAAAERSLLSELEAFELGRTDQGDAIGGAQWTLRSGHFVFGMPRLIDDRHNFTPDGFVAPQAGISIVGREGFVVANFDQMKVPLWVAQRWTRFDHTRMGQVPTQNRPWFVDMEMPPYSRGGTSYSGNQTELDRGHMARHAVNRAWGIDTSNWGVKMSNSAPQHRNVNRFGSAWGVLEDEVRDIVVSPGADIEAVWAIAGTIYRDETNPASETPQQDFADVVRLDSGDFGVPDATYKIVGWFDDRGFFQARGYVFDQPHSVQIVNGEQQFTYTLGDPTADLVNFIVAIDEIEERTGLDFFPMLRDDIEDLIEIQVANDLWGAQ